MPFATVPLGEMQASLVGSKREMEIDVSIVGIEIQTGSITLTAVAETSNIQIEGKICRLILYITAYVNSMMRIDWDV